MVDSVEMVIDEAVEVFVYDTGDHFERAGASRSALGELLAFLKEGSVVKEELYVGRPRADMGSGAANL